MKDQASPGADASPPSHEKSKAGGERMRPVEGLALVVLLAFVALIANVLRREFSNERMLSDEALMEELSERADQMARELSGEARFAKLSGNPLEDGAPIRFERQFSAPERLWSFTATRRYGTAEWRIEVELRLDPPGECVVQKLEGLRPDGRREVLTDKDP